MKDVSLEGHSMAPRRVSFDGGVDGLAGYLFLPPGEGPFPCVIDNHGSATPPGTTDLSHPQTAALFLSWGCAYLFPHRAGYGDSAGTPLSVAVTAPRGTAEHDSQMVERLGAESRDVLSALAFAASRDDIDETRIVAMGSSLGGIHTLMALAADARWKCGLDFSGGASQWAKHPRIKAAILTAVERLTQPVFLIQPANDFNTAPTEEIGALLAARDHPFESRIFPPWGTDGAEAHRFCAAGQQIWGGAAKAFLKTYL